MQKILIFALAFFGFLAPAISQELTVVTVTRPPFSMPENARETGFSIELWDAVAKDIGLVYKIDRIDNFGEMLDRVLAETADVAVANISITAQREKVLDFSQPIFESGLQIMTHRNSNSDISLIKSIFSAKLLSAIAISLAVLFALGMLMWRLEHKSQPYFDRPAKQAMFPAFWWALNLIVNGGFEERMPRTVLGRFLGVILVISSLFLVSIFVAKVTAVLTVDAIQNNVNSINDLYRKNVGTIEGSTSSVYLDSRDLNHQTFANLENLYAEFESGALDAVVFDSPILAYYVNTSNGGAELAGPVFRRENYGIVLQSGSNLAEPINQSLLKLRENGTYALIYRKWFGAIN